VKETAFLQDVDTIFGGEEVVMEEKLCTLLHKQIP